MCAAVLIPNSLVAQASIVQEIARSSARFDSAFATGDFKTQAVLLSEESVVMSAGVTATGRAAILELHRDLLARRPGITLVTQPDSIEVGPEGWNVASEQGFWIERWIEDGQQVEIRGRYQAMWRRDDDKWLRAALLLVPIKCSGPYCQR